MDIYINDVPRATNLAYKELTRYLSTRLGPRNLKVYETNTKNLLFEAENFDIPSGQLITQLVYGSVSDFKFVPIIDDINEGVSPDETKIRFYNLTNYNVNVSLSSSIGSSALTLDSGSGSKYTQIKPDSYTLEIRTPNQRPKTISINFKPGRIYTIYIINSTNPDTPGYEQINIPQVILVVDGNTVFTKCVFY